MQDLQIGPKLSKVDFYVLPYQDSDKYWLFVCNLLEKIYLTNLNVVVLVGDSEAASFLDNKLWTYKQQSFIPHEIITNDSNLLGLDASVLISEKSIDINELEVNFQVVLDLSDSEINLNADRIVIITDQSKEKLQTSRKKYKNYAKQNIEITTHKINVI